MRWPHLIERDAVLGDEATDVTFVDAEPLGEGGQADEGSGRGLTGGHGWCPPLLVLHLTRPFRRFERLVPSRSSFRRIDDHRGWRIGSAGLAGDLPARPLALVTVLVRQEVPQPDTAVAAVRERLGRDRPGVD